MGAVMSVSEAIAMWVFGFFCATILLAAAVELFPEFFLRESIKRYRAEAWDEGANAAVENAAIYLWEDGKPIANPYRKPGESIT